MRYVPISASLGRSASGLYSRAERGAALSGTLSAGSGVEKLRRGRAEERRREAHMQSGVQKWLRRVVVAALALWICASLWAADGVPHALYRCATSITGDVEGYTKTGVEHASLGSALDAARIVGTVIGDKALGHNYTAVYDHILSPYRARSKDTDVHILEVGVGAGGSMKLWREFFGPYASVLGIDIADYTPRFRRDARMKTLVLDARDGVAVKEALSTLAFDVIIDDATALGGGAKDVAATRAMYDNLRHHLKTTGVFVIEDWDRRVDPLEALAVRPGDTVHEYADASEFECLLTIAPNTSLALQYAPAGGWDARGRTRHVAAALENWQQKRLAELQEASLRDPAAIAAAEKEARDLALLAKGVSNVAVPPPLVLSSNYRGVHWDQRFNYGWKAQIKVDGKKRFLGVFATEEIAAQAFDKALRLYFPLRVKQLNFGEAPTPHPTAKGCPLCPGSSFCCKSSDYMGGAACCSGSMVCEAGKCVVPEGWDAADPDDLAPGSEAGWVESASPPRARTTWAAQRAAAGREASGGGGGAAEGGTLLVEVPPGEDIGGVGGMGGGV